MSLKRPPDIQQDKGDIAAARVGLWSSSTNAKYAESSSTNYILCEFNF